MAVQYVHSNKVLHRDLKTQNVFLMKNGVAKLGLYRKLNVLIVHAQMQKQDS